MSDNDVDTKKKLKNAVLFYMALIEPLWGSGTIARG
jgi:hypothetical protein